jgi:flavoprotein
VSIGFDGGTNGHEGPCLKACPGQAIYNRDARLSACSGDRLVKGILPALAIAGGVRLDYGTFRVTCVFATFRSCRSLASVRMIRRN